MDIADKILEVEARRAEAVEMLEESQAQHDRAVAAGEGAYVIGMLKSNILEARRVIGTEGRELEFLRWRAARAA